MKRFEFNFPRTRFVPGEGDTTRRGQADQITQEAAEAFSAAEKDSEQAYIIELLDCIQACETALREFDEDTIRTAQLKVIGKNQVRGYYEDGALEAHVTADEVEHPAHYNQGEVEAIQIIDEVTAGLGGFDGYCLGNVLKYSLRAGKKGDLQTDLEKANNYAHKLVYGQWRWQHGQETQD